MSLVSYGPEETIQVPVRRKSGRKHRESRHRTKYPDGHQSEVSYVESLPATRVQRVAVPFEDIRPRHSVVEEPREIIVERRKSKYDRSPDRDERPRQSQQPVEVVVYKDRAPDERTAVGVARSRYEEPPLQQARSTYEQPQGRSNYEQPQQARSSYDPPQQRDRALSMDRGRGYGNGGANSYYQGQDLAAYGGPRGYGGDPRRSAGELQQYREPERGSDRRSRRDELRDPKRGRSLSRNQEIAAGVAAAAVALGGKELWDRREGEGGKLSKNPLESAAIAAAGGFAGYEGAKYYSKHQGEISSQIRSKSRGLREKFEGRDDEDDYDRPRGGKGKSRGRGYDDDDDDYNRKRSKSKGKYAQAAQAAVIAAAVEAFRGRKEGGPITGERGQRILTAALGAGGIDALADNNPDKKGKRHVIEGVVGGLLANRAVNGRRSQSRDGDSRSRSRSRSQFSRSKSRGRDGGSGGGVKDLAIGGLAAAAAKKFIDSRKDRSRSRDRDDRGRGRGGYDTDSESSESEYDDRRSRRRSDRRRNSVSGVLNRGLSRLGLRDDTRSDTRDRSIEGGRRRSIDDRQIAPRDRGWGNPSRGAAAGAGYGNGNMNGGGQGMDRGLDRGARSEGDNRDKHNSSSSDICSSSEDDRRRKKMKKKELLSAGLATVASIHAVHGLMEAKEERDERVEQVIKGNISAETARKEKNIAHLKNAATIAIAAYGARGAYKSWGAMKEQRDEMKKWDETREERHQKRLDREKKQRERERNGGHDGGGGGGGGGPGGDPGYFPGGPSGGGAGAGADAGPGYGPSGPKYQDANPYSASGIPPPPLGTQYAPPPVYYPADPRR
jgi:hypothetical protein